MAFQSTLLLQGIGHFGGQPLKCTGVELQLLKDKQNNFDNTVSQDTVSLGRRWYLGTHSPPSHWEGMNSPNATSLLGWPWYLRTHSPPSHLREGMNSLNATAILGNRIPHSLTHFELIPWFHLGHYSRIVSLVASSINGRTGYAWLVLGRRIYRTAEQQWMAGAISRATLTSSSMATMVNAQLVSL